MILALSFGNPWVLLALLVPGGLIGWTWTRKGRRVVLPLDHGHARKGTFLRVVLQAAESLPTLAVAVAVLLLAGPRTLDTPKTQRSLTNIEFCVDISGSMTAPFGDGCRYDAAMTAINQFLDYREGDAFGLTFFGNNVLHWVPLTSDVSAFRCAPPFLHPVTSKRPNWFGGTSIGKALLACRDVLIAREIGDRMIILISDGQSSDLSGGVDMEIAQRLRKDGITVYGIHVAPGGVPGQVANIATVTGGQIFAPDDPGALDTVFRSIDEMQVTELEKIDAETIDEFELLCWIGLSILALHLLLQFVLRYTPW